MIRLYLFSNTRSEKKHNEFIFFLHNSIKIELKIFVCLCKLVNDSQFNINVKPER